MSLADIHCHILYGIDDGPKTKKEMYEMLDAAYENGVRILFATPHCNPEIFKYNPEKEQFVFNELKEYAKSKYPDMQLFKGTELFAYSRLPSEIQEGHPVFMNESNVLLTEALPDSGLDFFKKLTIALRLSGITPVFAHIERYKNLSFKNICTLKEYGAVITCNSSVFTKKLNFKKKLLINKLMINNTIDIITSDAHTPAAFQDLSKAYAHIKTKYGQEKADSLFLKNVLNIFEITSDSRIKT